MLQLRKPWNSDVFLRSLDKEKSILDKVSNAVFIFSNDIVGSWLFPKVVVRRGLTKANDSRNIFIVILGVRAIELQAVFWIKENSIGTGIRRG